MWQFKPVYVPFAILAQKKCNQGGNPFHKMYVKIADFYVIHI